MKVCVDCRHYSAERSMLAVQAGAANEPQCKHPEAATRDVVNGLCYCRQERQGSKGCGKAGKLWEART